MLKTIGITALISIGLTSWLDASVLQDKLVMTEEQHKAMYDEAWSTGFNAAIENKNLLKGELQCITIPKKSLNSLKKLSTPVVTS